MLAAGVIEEEEDVIAVGGEDGCCCCWGDIACCPGVVTVATGCNKIINYREKII